MWKEPTLLQLVFPRLSTFRSVFNSPSLAVQLAAPSTLSSNDLVKILCVREAISERFIARSFSDAADAGLVASRQYDSMRGIRASLSRVLGTPPKINSVRRMWP